MTSYTLCGLASGVRRHWLTSYALRGLASGVRRRWMTSYALRGLASGVHPRHVLQQQVWRAARVLAVQQARAEAVVAPAGVVRRRHRAAHAELGGERGGGACGAPLSRPQEAAHAAEFGAHGALEAATHDAVTDWVDARVGVAEPERVRVEATQQDAVRREQLGVEEVEQDAERVQRQPGDGEEDGHDEQHARHLAAPGEVRAGALGCRRVDGGMQLCAARRPQAGGDAQVADADEEDGRYVERGKQRKVVDLLEGGPDAP